MCFSEVYSRTISQYSLSDTRMICLGISGYELKLAPNLATNRMYGVHTKSLYASGGCYLMKGDLYYDPYFKEVPIIIRKDNFEVEVAYDLSLLNDCYTAGPPFIQRSKIKLIFGHTINQTYEMSLANT